MSRTDLYLPGETFIVKVQRSIKTTHPAPVFLIYDEHQIIMDEFPQAELPDLVEAMGEDLKQYFYADITEERLLNINTKSLPPWQEW